MKIKMRSINTYYYIFLFVIYIFSTTNSIVSRDFGAHWDERDHTSAIARSYDTGVFIQDWAAYPSALYYQTLAASLPHLFTEVMQEDPIISKDLRHQARYAMLQPGLRQALKRTGDYVKTKEFLLLARAVSIAISYLSVFWLFFLSKELFNSNLAGVLSALFFCASWEVLYHSRWLATDLIMIQWGLLSILLTLRFIRTDKVYQIMLAAVFAGFATASKYQGGLYWILSICCIIMLCRKSEIGLLRLLLLSFLSYTAGFLLLNPIAILTPVTFIEGFVYNSMHYAQGHDQWTVEPGIHHAYSILDYLTTQLSSKFPLASIAVTLLAVFGIWNSARNRNFVALILLVFPVFYFAYFANQRVMIVRNYLCLLPFITIFAANGANCLWQQANKPLKIAYASTLGLFAVSNCIWLAHSSQTIIQYSFEDNNAALVEHLNNAEGPTFVSNEIWAILSDGQKAQLIAKNTDAEEDPTYIAIGYEISSWQLPANRPNDYNVILGGPYEINFSYYPGFSLKENRKWRYVEVSESAFSGKDGRSLFNGWPAAE